MSFCAMCVAGPGASPHPRPAVRALGAAAEHGELQRDDVWRGGAAVAPPVAVEEREQLGGAREAVGRGEEELRALKEVRIAKAEGGDS